MKWIALLIFAMAVSTHPAPVVTSPLGHWVTEEVEDLDTPHYLEHYVLPDAKYCGSVRQEKEAGAYTAWVGGSRMDDWEERRAAEKQVERECDTKYKDQGPGNRD